jgi:hypothetical protein
VAALGAAAIATASAAAVPLRELSWSFGKRTHFLRVGPPADAHPMPGLELPVRRVRSAGAGGKGDDRERPTSERRVLLSVVGPIVSRYTRAAGGGPGGWVTEHIETEWLDGYTFDLRAYLLRNGRLPQALEGADLERFAVVDWDGQNALTLVVERKGCERQRSTCSLETETVVAPPPGGWRPWLEAALRGEGFLERRAVRWWTARGGTTGGSHNPRAPIR